MMGTMMITTFVFSCTSPELGAGACSGFDKKFDPQNILMLRKIISIRKEKYYQHYIFTWIGVLFGELGEEVGILVTLGT